MEKTPPVPQEYNILVTTDANYIPYLNIMLSSLLYHNPEDYFHVYLLHAALREEDVTKTRELLRGAGALHLIRVDDSSLADAPTSGRYPKAIYYRIFAAQYLPASLNRILYLDPDIIVNKSIAPLYQTELEDYYFAAASHIRPLLHKANEIRLNMEPETLYINSGVMLMNLELLRKEQNTQDVFDFIEKYGPLLMLPDQDIISSLYGSRILALDTFRYNMTDRLYTQHALFERTLDLEWVRNNSVIIHYCGRNKPWKPAYHGQLGVFYQEAAARMERAPMYSRFRHE